ncbi:hypothetical protein BT96DRAFT_619369 [Gymnopus androsaceus JB14]|uniref:F-box domain-containing protein n=1 Tax=Gymnopus androsaceus JB14 TaxID=1447944 RepID=A0A6A4HWE9_9AGAR|nr:hypothetical protein BT96DRAFT_619369 [Gymnopus androsaceus JB14]
MSSPFNLWWPSQVVLEALGCLPSLKTFSLRSMGDCIDPPIGLSKNLGNFTSLSIESCGLPPSTIGDISPIISLISTSPQLASLNFTLPKRYTKPSSRQLFEGLPLECTLPLMKLALQSWELSGDSLMSRRHFSALKSLHLSNCSLPEGKFWAVLRGLGTALDDLAVDHVDDALVSYLCSYRGLERFQLKFGVGFKTTVNKLFVALHKHADFLRALKIKNSAYHVSISYAYHIARLRSLTSLKITATKQEVSERCIDNTLGSLISASNALCHLHEIKISGNLLKVNRPNEREALHNCIQASLIRLQSRWPHRSLESKPLAIRILSGLFTLCTTVESYIKLTGRYPETESSGVYHMYS